MDESTRRKYRTMLKQLRAYADGMGFRYLNQFTVDELTRFRASWKDGLRSGAKKLERVRAVFRFAHEREWIPKNPAAKLKPPVGSSKPANKHPFTDEEIKKLFEACANYQTRRWSNSFAEGEVTGEQIQTFMMLLMYTGLRISDAATFNTDKLQGNNAFLFMHKTDEPVFTWIPDELIHRLKNTPLQRGKYYFIGSADGAERNGGRHVAPEAGSDFRIGGSVEDQSDSTPLPAHLRSVAASARR